MSQPAERPPFLPYMLIVVPILLSAGLAAVAWLLPLEDTKRIQALWTLTALLIGSVMTILLRHYELHKSITELTRGVADARASNENIAQANGRAMRIEQSLRDDEQFNRIAKLNDVMGKIYEARLTHPDLNDLIRWRVGRLFDRAIHSHTELSTGLIVIDDENKELNTNEVFLRNLAEREIKAVSFEDEVFWSSPEGAEFLRAHEQVIQSKRIKIRRIFVLERPVDEYQKTLEKQLEVGVEVKTISREKAQKVKLEDFVLYDNRFMRTGYQPPDVGPHDGMHKFASLTWQAARLEPYVEAFDSLWRQGLPFPGQPK